MNLPGPADLPGGCTHAMIDRLTDPTETFVCGECGGEMPEDTGICRRCEALEIADRRRDEVKDEG